MKYYFRLRFVPNTGFKNTIATAANKAARAKPIKSVERRTIQTHYYYYASKKAAQAASRRVRSAIKRDWYKEMHGLVGTPGPTLAKRHGVK